MSHSANYISHILELRKRLTLCLATFVLVASPLVVYSRELFNHFAQILVHLPNTQMIALEVASPFVVPIKLALYSAIFISAPVFCFHVWQFMAPGLYPNEKKPILLLSSLSLLLFYCGAFFAYFVVCHIAIKFFVSFSPNAVHVMTDMNHYLSFILKMMLMFGLAFQVPIIVSILIMVGLQSPLSLKKKRPIIIVMAFIIGMILTPPDVVSQVLMAVPMIGLFELGILLGAALKSKPQITHGSAP